MSLTNITQPLCALERGWCLVKVDLTVGATGAVSAVSGKGFANGAPSGEQGGITRTSEGLYVITLPGRGGVQEICPLQPVIRDGAAADYRPTLLTAVSASARTFSWTFLTADTPAASGVDDPTSGSVITFFAFVKQSSVS